MKTPGVRGKSFSSHFANLWSTRVGDVYDKNELRGYFHKTSGSRIEIVWVPERPSDKRAITARSVFVEALKTLDESDGDRLPPPVTSVDPIIGHVAVKLFCEPNAFIRELHEVSVVREFETENEPFIARPNGNENTIG